MTVEKLDSSKRKWLAPAVGLFVGIVSLLAGQLVDAMLSGRMPDLPSFLGHYVLAGATFALAFSSTVRAMLPTRTERFVNDWPAVHSSTVAFVLFLVPTLVAAPDSTGRWLPFFYAISILLGWLSSQSRLGANQGATAPIHRLVDWDRMPYALFVAVALVLLIASPICSAADQRSAALQLANWAYGFLLLGVLIATLCFLLDRDLEEHLGHLFRFALPIGVVAFFPLASFVDANSHSPAESLLITDVYPNFLAQQQRPGDILISDSPSLRLTNIPRIAQSLNVNPDERGQALWDDLTRALDTQQRVLWITVPGQSHDTEGTLATFLKANGCLEYVSNTSLPVLVYELNKPLVLPRVLPPFWATHTADAFDPVMVNFGPIQMTGIRFERRACSHDSVAVSMRWQLAAKTTSPLKVSLFLSDGKGRRIQMQDFVIDDASQRHTDQWQPGAALPASYLLTIPLGTPPGTYKLGAGVYPVSQPQWLHVGSAEGVEIHSDHIELGTVDIYRALDVSADPWGSRQESGMLPANVAVANGLVLDGYKVANPTIIPGEPLHLALRWRAENNVLPSYTTKVSLRQGDKVIAEEAGVPVDGTYPTDQWKPGEYVTERKELRVPADVAGGLAPLQVSVVGGKTTYLADIEIESVTRTFQMPVVGYSTHATFKAIGDLVGYDLPKTPIAAHQPFEVTLHWRAGASIEKDYTVFAQLLAADGHLIAQSDSQPARGRRPTRSWLPGEFVGDQHTLDFKDQAYQGEAKLIVGFYDAETGDRVAVEGSSDNYFLVPTRVQVVAK